MSQVTRIASGQLDKPNPETRVVVVRMNFPNTFMSKRNNTSMIVLHRGSRSWQSVEVENAIKSAVSTTTNKPSESSDSSETSGDCITVLTFENVEVFKKKYIEYFFIEVDCTRIPSNLVLKMVDLFKQIQETINKLTMYF